jgi:large subunit ribosomal protein L22
MTEVKAHVRYLRMSPRKVRLVVDLIRGMAIAPALAQLQFMPKAAATPVRKLLQSAIANAEHNFKLDRDTLFVKSALVNQGPTLKRWRPRAMGSAAPILKRTSHITLVLGTKEAPAAEKTEKTEGKKDKKTAAKHALSKGEGKAPAKKAAAKKK